jgi:mono/diheme cytochrome c family protein
MAEQFEDRSMAAKRTFRRFATGLIVLLVVVIGAGLLVYAGVYNVGADSPHFPVVYRLLETVRDRSVAARAEQVRRPGDLGDPKRIAVGGALYGEMCSGCHLGPGMERTEISQGLYPRAPDFSQGTDLTPEEAFWVIKHGIKMSGMAAWGVTHSDNLIWDMVAFLGKLPSLSPDEFKKAIANSAEDHDQAMHDMPMPSEPK